MDGKLHLLSDGSTLVDGLADNVDDASEGLGADGHLNGESGVCYLAATDEAFRGVHSNRPHGVFAEVLRDLEDESGISALDFESVENLGHAALKLDVDDSADNLRDGASLGRKRALRGETASGRGESGEHAVGFFSVRVNQQMFVTNIGTNRKCIICLKNQTVDESFIKRCAQPSGRTFHRSAKRIVVVHLVSSLARQTRSSVFLRRMQQ